MLSLYCPSRKPAHYREASGERQKPEARIAEMYEWRNNFINIFCDLPFLHLSGQKTGTSSMTMAKTTMVRIEPILTKSKKR